MVEWHRKSRRKASGGLRKSLHARDKRLSEKGGLFTATHLDAGLKQNKVVAGKTLGGNSKSRVQRAKYANVLDPNSKKHELLEIVQVKTNAANRDYARRNIITHGALIEVKKGSEIVLATVKNRPGQSGSIEVVLVQTEKK